MLNYTYILQSLKDKKLYIGYTNNLKRRIVEHNDGKSFATSPRQPFRLIYYEASLSKRYAQEREWFFKTGWGRKHLSRMLKFYKAKI